MSPPAVTNSRTSKMAGTRCSSIAVTTLSRRLTKRASASTRIASTPDVRTPLRVASSSASSLAGSTRNVLLSAFAANSTVPASAVEPWYFGLISKPKVEACGTKVFRSSKRFLPRSVVNTLIRRGIATGPVQACHKSQRHRISTNNKHDRNRAGRRLSCQRADVPPRSGEHVHTPRHQIRSEFHEPLVATTGPAILKRDILALDIPFFPAIPHEMSEGAAQTPPLTGYLESQRVAHSVVRAPEWISILRTRRSPW